jgi:hypothetical protein
VTARRASSICTYFTFDWLVGWLVGWFYSSCIIHWAVVTCFPVFSSVSSVFQCFLLLRVGWLVQLGGWLVGKVYTFSLSHRTLFSNDDYDYDDIDFEDVCGAGAHQTPVGVEVPQSRSAKDSEGDDYDYDDIEFKDACGGGKHQGPGTTTLRNRVCELCTFGMCVMCVGVCT